ncbi:Lysophospholipase L1 [Geodermatophilus telluris]|uniref:Lysophospholipase L1 n=1 Tax=Geodermatophilus telluris TaxID=1190417 RepID=A0A1G6IJF0_9ACTN|nr:Lysophospholipase L1 [Geodermatophilus telluris]
MLLVLLCALVSTAACTATPDVQAEDREPEEVVLVVVGDSLTAGTEPLADGEVRGQGSWVPAALGDPLVLGGGWAVPGATTGDMRQGVGRVDGDVLLVMAGTNDVAQGVAWEASRDNLLTVTRTLRLDEVIVSAIPPSADHAAAATAYNEQLRQFALEQGWTYVDPWETARDGEGWVAGGSADGIHPTQQVADEVGRTLRVAVLARAAGG